MSSSPPDDSALLRGMTQRRLSRRDALRISGLSAAGLALAACGVKGKATTNATTPAADAVAKFWAGKTGKGHVDFANWPLYMDPKKPELKQFTDKTGITVNYQEVIQDDPTWFTKIQPQLAANQSIGFDLMVVTNGVQFTDLVKLGYLAPLDHKRLPNFAASAADKYKHEAYDPGNVYSVPWASGITGIAYDPDKVTTAPTSMADLWNPKYKGKVGMMSDTQELANFGLLAVGANPDSSAAADWQRAADKLKQQRDGGLVRKYYDQSYIDALGKGDVWITMAWSGDIFQKNLSDGTNLQFVIPSEGATLWTDNMMIPITAANPVDAITLMDFFYDPAIAGSLAEYINYITPVPSAKATIQSDASQATGDDKVTLQALVTSPLIFPSDADYGRLHYYVQFKTPAEQQQFNALFDPIVTG
jgi:spermidine/putrescine transport system substrate-binding protein